MKTIVRILAISCLMASASVQAQELSVVQERQLNLDALRALENYESCATLYGNAARMEFDLLFRDRNLQIFNDLNGLAASPTLSVANYSEILSTKGRSAQVIIKNLNKGKPYYEDGEWKIDVTFDKEISYANTCQILFSSSKYFGADFHMQMTLAWDEDLRQCLITKLDGQKGSDVEMLPADYAILSYTDERDHKLEVDGDTLTFNSFGQAYLPANPKFKYPDPDVRVKVKHEDPSCNLISLDYKPKRWRLKAHYDLSLGDFYKADGSIETKTSGSEASIELGYIFPSRSNVKWGFFFGGGISMSKFDMNIGSLSYYYQAEGEEDIDQDSYTRFYDMKNISQTFKSTDVIAPVYLDMDIRFSKNFSFYLDAGIKAYLNLKNEQASNSGTYSTWGYYGQYGIEMRPDDHWSGTPINGFVTDQPISSNLGDSDYKFKKFSLDGLGRAGFRILLYKNLFLDAAASYQMSIISPFDADSSSSIVSGQIARNDAVMTYNVASGEIMHGLLNCFSSLRRQSLNLNIGLMLRF